MNPTINYLAFCEKFSKRKPLILYKNIYVSKGDSNFELAKNTRVYLDSYSKSEDLIELRIKYTSNSALGECCYRMSWQDEVPITHFESAEEAYKHCRFTGVVLGNTLEEFIFSGSSKFACVYAINVSNKRLPISLETKVMKNYRYLVDYCRAFEIDLTEEQEKVFLKDKKGEFVVQYALSKIKGKLPDALHNYLIMKYAEKPNNYWLKMYFEKLK